MRGQNNSRQTSAPRKRVDLRTGKARRLKKETLEKAKPTMSFGEYLKLLDPSCPVRLAVFGALSDANPNPRTYGEALDKLCDGEIPEGLVQEMVREFHTPYERETLGGYYPEFFSLRDSSGSYEGVRDGDGLEDFDFLPDQS